MTDSHALKSQMPLITNVTAIFLILIGYVSPVFSNQILNIGFYALSGALTNWLAIHMLFEKVPGLYGSGVIPSRFEDFKTGIHDLVMSQFFNKENVERFFSEQASSRREIDVEPLLSNVDYEILFNKLLSALSESPLGGMLQMIGGVGALEPIKPFFVEKMQEALKEISHSDTFQSAVRKSLSQSFGSDELMKQVDHIVERRLAELTPAMVKGIVQKMIKEHLGWLVVWGGVFGGLVGLIASFVI